MKNRLLSSVAIIALCFTMLVACSKGPAEVTSRTDKTNSKTTQSLPGTQNGVNTVSPTERTLSPVVTKAPGTNKEPTETIETPEIAENGKITVNSELSNYGSLVIVGKNNLYNGGNGLKTIEELEKLDNKQVEAWALTRVYGNKKAQYGLKKANIYMNTNAFKAFESMINAFNSETGAKDVQLVSAYDYTDTSSLESEASTGYTIKLNAYDSATYPFNYGKHTVKVDGKDITYLEWFNNNCAKYGFIYTGLSGDENNQLANYRYVGTVFAKYITDSKLTVDQFIAKVKDGSIKSVKDPKDNEWLLTYALASKEATTVIDLGTKAEYIISGTNEGGFIVAVKDGTQTAPTTVATTTASPTTEAQTTAQ